MLPGHQLPFVGLHTRSSELIAHHELRCAAIAEACRAAPRSAAELVPVLFSRALDPHQMSFAFSEVQAHVNYMLRKGELAWVEGCGRRRARRRGVTAAPALPWFDKLTTGVEGASPRTPPSS